LKGLDKAKGWSEIGLCGRDQRVPAGFIEPTSIMSTGGTAKEESLSRRIERVRKGGREERNLRQRIISTLVR